MTAPAVTTCSVTQQYLDYTTLVAQAGSLEFRAVDALSGDPIQLTRSDGVILVPAPIQVVIDSTGTATATLVCTDSANVTPTGWVWNVTTKIAGQRKPAWNFSLPSSGAPGPVTLSSLAPAVAVGTSSSYLLGNQLGAVNGVAELDSGGLLLTAERPIDLTDHPAALGTAGPGVSVLASPSDHIHPITGLVTNSGFVASNGTPATPNASLGVYGSYQTLTVPVTGFSGVLVVAATLTFASVGSETVTANVTFTFSDASTQSTSVNPTATSNQTTALAVVGGLVKAFKNGVYVTGIEVQAKSSINSSTATVTLTAYGQNIG
jgi:hypothetical protein